MSYQIKAGDTIEQIAAFFGVSVDALIKLNPGVSGKGNWLKLSPNDSPGRGLGADVESVRTGLNFAGEPMTAQASSGILNAEGAGSTGAGGNTPETVSILTSSTMIWYFDKDTGKWYVSYAMPNQTDNGSDRRIFFEATGENMDAIFGEGQRPTTYKNFTFEGIAKTQTFGGDILEMSGTGSFEQEVERTIQLGLDEGKLPSWAQDDPQVMDIVYMAQQEKKSIEWVIEKISKLDSFRARFPGLQTYINQGLSIAEAVKGFIELESGIKEQMVRQGANPNSLTPNIVGDLIAKGHSLTDVQMVYDSFERFTNNEAALAAFNEVLVQRGQAPLSADDQIDFLEGNAAPELYRIWEEASFNQAAKDAGLDIGVQDAIALAHGTEGFTSYNDAFASLQKAAANLLRFRGDLDAQRYGLDTEDLIDISVGIAPRSGRSAAEISQGMERALSAARAGTDGPRAQRFRQYGEQGTPQAVSTRRARAQE